MSPKKKDNKNFFGVDKIKKIFPKNLYAKKIDINLIDTISNTKNKIKKYYSKLKKKKKKKK